MQIIYFSDEVWMWVHQKYVMNGIIQKIHPISKKQMLLPCYYQQCSIESGKRWMRVMKYKGEYLKNMKWAKSYKIACNCKNNCYWLAVADNVWLNQKKLWIWEWSMKVSTQKNGMSWIIQKFHSIKKLLLPCCYQQCLVESTKWYMRVIQYEGK